MSLEKLHHAYLLETGGEALSSVLSFLGEHNIQIPNDSPDTIFVSLDRMGVGDVAALLSHVQTKPVALSHRVVTIECADITTEAQNALLKVIEEPPAPTIFFLFTSAPHSLLPTLRSRFQIVSEGKKQSMHSMAEAFVSSSVNKRLDTVKELLSAKDDAEVQALKNLTHFLTSIEHLLEKKTQQPGMGQGIRSLYAAKRALTTPGAALKPVLEQFAILLPSA